MPVEMCKCFFRHWQERHMGETDATDLTARGCSKVLQKSCRSNFHCQRASISYSSWHTANRDRTTCASSHLQLLEALKWNRLVNGLMPSIGMTKDYATMWAHGRRNPFHCVETLYWHIYSPSLSLSLPLSLTLALLACYQFLHFFLSIRLHCFTSSMAALAWQSLRFSVASLASLRFSTLLPNERTEEHLWIPLLLASRAIFLTDE